MFWDHEAYAFVYRYDGAPLQSLEAWEKERGIRDMGNILGVLMGDFGNDETLDFLLHYGEQGRFFCENRGGNINKSAPIVIPELPKTASVVDASAESVPDIFVAFANGTRGF